jgi:hypothetical protein
MPYPFDWKTFFKGNRIEYQDESSREILIKCPWCGMDDPSHHLSVNLEGKGYRCFRNSDHRGRSPARLIQVLLKCSIDHARALCGMSVALPAGAGFMAQIKGLLEPPNKLDITKCPRLPEEFKPLLDKPSAWPFLSYMKSRGYEFKDILQLSRTFDLHYCTSGPFRGRVIFLVKRHGKLLNWTGRAVSKDTIPRYRSHTTMPELAALLGLDPAAESISNLLLWHDLLETSKAHTMVVCEGPYDALRVNHFGMHQGIIATCLFTMQASTAQIESLRDLIRHKFKRGVLLLDRGTLDKSVAIGMRLPELKVTILPDGTKDPGSIKTLVDFHRLGLTSP